MKGIAPENCLMVECSQKLFGEVIRDTVHDIFSCAVFLCEDGRCKGCKHMNKTLKDEGIKVCMILLGVALNAFATATFCLPYNILIGGSTGVGRIISFFTPVPVAAGVMAANIFLLILAFFLLGKRYAASIILGSLTYPVLLGIFEGIIRDTMVVEDPLLAALCGGTLMGAGIGLAVRSGGSLGGSDVIPLILNKKFKTSVATMMNVIDVIILLLQCFMATTNEIILGILMTVTYSFVTNRVLLMGGGQIQFMIFSPKHEEIRRMLTEELNMGVTVMHARSGYFNKETEVLVSAMSNRDMNRVKDKVLEIDNTAFMTISSVREITGRGFTLAREEK